MHCMHASRAALTVVNLCVLVVVLVTTWWHKKFQKKTRPALQLRTSLLYHDTTTRIKNGLCFAPLTDY